MISHLSVSFIRFWIAETAIECDLAVLDTILDFYSTLGQTEARAQTNSAELKALRSHVTRVLAPTLQKLRALPSSLRRTRAINKWTNLAKALELRETSWPEDITIDDSSHSHSRRCHWHDCMCSHTDPAHSIRVCKGCWQVFYCSRQCQRRYVCVNSDRRSACDNLSITS